MNDHEQGALVFLLFTASSNGTTTLQHAAHH
jgi:hypothetical protein